MKRLSSTILFALLALLTTLLSAQDATPIQTHLKAVQSSVAARRYDDAASHTLAAVKICIDAHNYKGALGLVQNVEHAMASAGVSPEDAPRAYYTLEKANYAVMSAAGNTTGADAALAKMNKYASSTADKKLVGDALFNAAQHFYATGRISQGDIAIAQLIKQYDSEKNYKAADQAYRHLIAKAVNSGDARLVGQTYENYMEWSDSIEAIGEVSELNQVKEALAQEEALVKSKNRTITARTSLFITFLVLFGAAVAVLGIGALFYFRVVRKNRRMRRSVQQAREQCAEKSKMLHDMSDHIEPSLEQLPQDSPAVKRIRTYMNELKEFPDLDLPEGLEDPGPDVTKEWEEVSDAVGTQIIEHPTPGAIKATEVNLEQFCRQLAEEIRPSLKPHVRLMVDGAKGVILIDADETRQILSRLMQYAAKITPAGGRITLVYRKRGPHIHQFSVVTSAQLTPAERDNIFKPFSGATPPADTEADTLSLPICAIRAQKMGATLKLDPEATSTTSFLLTIR